MAEITAALVKELREKTGAGMMDCKKALAATGGDLEGAVDWLRKSGLAAAAKKASRVAAEGLVGIAIDRTRGAVVEVNAETDFVGRNEQFQTFVREVAGVTLAGRGDVQAIRAAKLASGGTVADRLNTLVATIGENLALRRVARVVIGTGAIASYTHNAVAEGLGRIGVVVGLESTGDADKVAAFGRQLAMHTAAAAPQWTDIGDIAPEALERERNILSEQARSSGKPEVIVAKMVEGRLRKFYEEAVLLEQIFVIDGESRVRKAVEVAGKAAGAPIRVTGFVRFALGEGIERQHADFAAEVAAAVKS